MKTVDGRRSAVDAMRAAVLTASEAAKRLASEEGGVEAQFVVEDARRLARTFEFYLAQQEKTRRA